MPPFVLAAIGIGAYDHAQVGESQSFLFKNAPAAT